MINLKNLDKWMFVPEGQGVQFDKQEIRRVRIEVNAPEKTRITLMQDDKATFLAVIEGYDLIEFVPPAGGFEIIADTDVYLYTAEFEFTSFFIPDAVIFTKIAERRARNPEIEYLMHKMQENMEKRLSQAAYENERRMSAFAAQVAAEKAAEAASDGDDQGTSSSGAKPGEPGPDAGAGGSGTAAPAAEPAGA